MGEIGLTFVVTQVMILGKDRERGGGVMRDTYLLGGEGDSLLATEYVATRL